MGQNTEAIATLDEAEAKLKALKVSRHNRTDQASVTELRLTIARIKNKMGIPTDVLLILTPIIQAAETLENPTQRANMLLALNEQLFPFGKPNTASLNNRILDNLEVAILAFQETPKGLQRVQIESRITQQLLLANENPSFNRSRVQALASLMR